MFLENVRPQKRNSNVTVNQTIYHIGPGGFIAAEDDPTVPFDVPDEDAKKLLAGKSWRPLSWDPEDPANANRFIKSAGGYPARKGLGRPPRDMSGIKDEFGGKPIGRTELPPQAIGTGSRAGELSGVENEAPSDEQLMKAVERDQKTEEADAASGKRVAGAQMSSSDVVLVGGDVAVGDGKPPAGASPVAVDPPVPADGDWPEPTPVMSRDYLEQMADAYEVKYSKRLGDEKLIERIKGAMYE